MKINVLDILSSSNASLHDDGIKVYREIKKHFNDSKKEEIEVDFSDIKRCSTLFLNASFGKLLADYGEEDVKKYIHPSSYSQILNFMNKYSDMWDNFVNKDNYQAYREEALA
ncbi:STAS-like domain-containing protein [Solitalea lacus]|uniref:STAS-like domain-containing protein n=1 Tax=Solitalea lacus TaxID=2911172 RepID=UPI001EDC1611|nr:STAS-like domain-containing protein [Solitalea lacus]UKJ07364.1 STAS-like domain-containing protein [Solitalea lacus]